MKEGGREGGEGERGREGGRKNMFKLVLKMNVKH